MAWLIRRFPTKIEADLQRQYRCDVALWHRGELSSRKLLSLLENLVDPSACRMDPRWPLGRDQLWPEAVRIAAETHKELALLRAGNYAGGPNAYEPKVFLPPEERAQRFIEAAQEEAFHEEAELDLFSNLGWT